MDLQKGGEEMSEMSDIEPPQYSHDPPDYSEIHPPKHGNKRLQHLKRAPFTRAASLPENSSDKVISRSRSGSSSAATSPDKAVSSKSSTADKLATCEKLTSFSTKEYNNDSHRVVFHSGLRDIGNNLAWSHKHELIVDVNNVPQIDQVITPPPSPDRTGRLQHFRNRFTSLKFKKNRPTTLRYQHRASLDNINTAIPTVTVNDVTDEDTMHREALLKSKYSNNVCDVQYIGDEASLYGTPKEDLSPTKEVESQRTPQSATNYLKDQIISFFQPSDNKLAMKLFGNKNALMKEKLRQKAAGNWVIHPCSNFR